MIQICTCVNVVNGPEPPKIDPECPVHGKPVPMKMYVTPCKKCVAAEAENKRLREALKTIVIACPFPENDLEKAIRNIAQQALAEKP